METLRNLATAWLLVGLLLSGCGDDAGASAAEGAAGASGAEPDVPDPDSRGTGDIPGDPGEGATETNAAGAACRDDSDCGGGECVRLDSDDPEGRCSLPLPQTGNAVVLCDGDQDCPDGFECRLLDAEESGECMWVDDRDAGL